MTKAQDTSVHAPLTELYPGLLHWPVEGTTCSLCALALERILAQATAHKLQGPIDLKARG